MNTIGPMFLEEQIKAEKVKLVDQQGNVVA
jgi:hypothetical protein